MKQNKNFLWLVTIIIFMGLVGCGANKESQLRTAADKVMKGIREYDDSVMKQIVEKA